MDVLLREAEHLFPGGLALAAMKKESTAQPILRPPLPKICILALDQQTGPAATPIVKSGDHVLKGQLIAKKNHPLSANIHAPTSGIIQSIGFYPIAHASNQLGPCIHLIPDGEDQWVERMVTSRDWLSMSQAELLKLITDGGIVGLGGAVFPSDIKLQNQNADHAESFDPIKGLIINGAECEPYISCDDMLMREHAYELLYGIQILMQLTRAERCMFGIEDNKPEAIDAIRQALSDIGDYRIELYTLKSIYPQGGEKQLFQSLIGEEIPTGKYPKDLGYLMFNVGTAKAIHDVIVDDKPLLSRIVTVAGHGVKQARNVEALIGTPVYELLEFCGGYRKQENELSDVSVTHRTSKHRLIMGGPLMGVALHTDSVPVTKAMNCLLVANEEDKVSTKTAMPCIRCGECAQVCPASLLPQQMYWYTKSKDYPEVERFHIFDCIECGACDYVCPSHIPLVNYFKHAKGEIREQRIKNEFSDQSRDRFEQRERRLDRIAEERKAKLAARKLKLNNKPAQSDKTLSAVNKEESSTNTKKDAIQAIMQRVNAKKNSNNSATSKRSSENNSENN